MTGLYGTAAESSGGLYDGIKPPVKKGAEWLDNALAQLNRKLSSSTTPQQKLSDPVRTMLDNVRESRNIPVQDNTAIAYKPVFPDPVISASPFKPTSVMFDPQQFKKDTASKESGNNPNAKSTTSSATGTYQFLWGQWGDSIKKVTGVKDEKDFRANPKAQDKFFDFYANKVVAPAVTKLMPLAEQYNLTENQVARIIHFRGETGAAKALKENLLDKKLEKNNPTINQYLGRSK